MCHSAPAQLLQSFHMNAVPRLREGSAGLPHICLVREPEHCSQIGQHQR
uniref:Uncharacterized protein n=1 Tax=Anguilla anguilla TaxID=7936 RepID=A0A0E9WXV6_ANGAN